MKKTSILAIFLSLIMVLNTFSAFAVTEISDGGITLWFDYSTEKTAKSDATDTGMRSFTVYMAKNEIENAQFFLSADSDYTGLSADITQFADANGNTIETELFIEYYHNCGDYGYLPDALPPVDAYVAKHGGITLSAGVSQGFIIKLTTTAETAAGDYSATVNIYDNGGSVIKSATVNAHVWDFELSEETACATSMSLDYNMLIGAVTESGVTNKNLYKSYYDFMLENRICAYFLPESVYSNNAVAYMDNPRVTSYHLGNYTGSYIDSLSAKQIEKLYSLFEGEENAHRFEKGLYFFNDKSVLDACTPEALDALKAKYDSVAALVDGLAPSYADKPFYHMATFFYDIDYTTADGSVIDQIDVYDDTVSLWCSKPFGYTTPDELGEPGTKVIQDSKWDSVYGTFSERMANYKKDGDKVWWFISNDVYEPYINYYIQTDGVAQRVLFWQQYDNNVEGFLYNFANFWMGSTKEDPYNCVLPDGFTDQYGEWMLLYPGDTYGLGALPVSSLRFEAMRDGIEDYQYFHMLEELKGEGYADSYIDKMTTGVTRYSTDDKAYYEARIALGNKIEAITLGVDVEDECDHEYELGICTKCGEMTENITMGDINFDTKTNISDIFCLKSYLAGSLELGKAQLIAADIVVDNAVNLADIFELKNKLTGN